MCWRRCDELAQIMVDIDPKRRGIDATHAGLYTEMVCPALRDHFLACKIRLPT